MLIPIIWLLLLSQEPVGSLGELLDAIAAAVQTPSEPQRRVAESQNHLLEKRFQRLVDDLQRFADEYNRSGGRVWPLREAEAVRKAYRDFDLSMSSGR
jgi:hypothetical protein